MRLRPSDIVLQAEGFVGSAFDVARRCRWHTGRAGFAVAVDFCPVAYGSSAMRHFVTCFRRFEIVQQGVSVAVVYDKLEVLLLLDHLGRAQCGL